MGRIGTAIFFASLFVVGCGSVKDSGGAVDAGGDAGPDADESGDATVTTKGFGEGQTAGENIADVDLISTLPNGTVLATAKSDASGNATIKVFPGGMVTAVYKRVAPDLGADLVTVVGVKPGEPIEFGQRTPASGTATVLGTQTYSWPTAPNGAVTNYRVQTSCASQTIAAPTLSSGALTERSNCNSAMMDVIYTAIQGGSNGLLQCGSRQNVTFANGANVALGSWQNPAAATSNITGLPASVTFLSSQFSTVINGNQEIFISGGGTASGAPSGGAFTGNFPWCQFGERTNATLNMNRTGNFGSIRVIDSLPSNATSWTVASPALPPWLEGTVLLSAYLGIVQWVFVPEGTPTADATYLAVNYQVQLNSMTFNNRWHFVMPPEMQVLTMPKLPSQFADIVPKAELGMGFNRLITIDVPTINGYDAFRAMGTSLAICPECFVRSGEIQRVITSGF